MMVLNKLKNNRTRKEQIRVARDCILEGIALADWKMPAQSSIRKMEYAMSMGNIHKANYWKCMSWMANEEKTSNVE